MNDQAPKTVLDAILQRLFSSSDTRGSNLVPPPPEPTIPTCIPQGYLIQYTDQSHAEDHHQRFGTATQPGARCPNCDEPMILFMDVDTRDPRLGLSHLPFSSLPLLYCFSCTLCLSNLYYRIDEQGGITILPTEQVQGETYDGEIPTLPAVPVRLQPLTPEEQEFLREGHKTFPTSYPADQTPPFEYLYGHNDQIGGIPFLEADWSETYAIICPCCSGEMPFLATFGTATPEGEPMLGEENYVQLVYTFCDRCHVVGAAHTNFM